MDLNYPIAYLERNDFSDSGELLVMDGKPVLIMIQAGYCGGCTAVKPEFQKLADEGSITCMTIQLDGERQSEKDLNIIMNNIYPNLETVPSYILYMNKQKRIPYTGSDRSFESLKSFVNKIYRNHV